MKVTVISDLHKGASYEVKCDMDLLIEQQKRIPTVWLGDNLDFRNCKKEMLPRLDSWYIQLKTYFGKFFLFGNHEDPTLIPSFVVINKTILIHSHLILWHKNKLNQWAKMFRRGKGTSLLSRLINWCRELNDREMKEEELEKLSTYALNEGYRRICIGHVHPHQILYCHHNGVEIIVVPRGISEIEC